MSEEEKKQEGEGEAAPAGEVTTQYVVDREFLWAQSHARAIRAFYIDLFLFFFIMTGVTLINMYLIDGPYWFHLPIVLWSVILLGHAGVVYGLFGIWGRGWEEEKIVKIQAKDVYRRNVNIEKAKLKAKKKKKKKKKGKDDDNDDDEE